MKTLFNKFLKENNLSAENLVQQQQSRPKALGVLTKEFSCWLSGHTDEKKMNKRFRSTYRVNKFMVRKYLTKLTQSII